MRGAEAELSACKRWEGEAAPLLVVEEGESGREDVAGYAIWGWSERVSYLSCVFYCSTGGFAKLLSLPS